MRSRLIYYLIACIIVVIIVGWMILRYFEIAGMIAWNTWVNDIQIVSQPGSDERSVRLLLGKPDSVQTDYQPLKGIIPAPPSHINGTKRVLVYNRAFVGKGYWVTYIHIDNRGKVIAYHIATS